MNTTNLNLPKLSMLGASLLVTGMLSGSIVMANESASGSTTGSHGHSTTSGGSTSGHGSMHMDCPDDLKEGDECPEGWKPESSGQNMPEQGSDSYGGEGGSGGMDTGTGGSTTGGSTGGGSGSSSDNGTSQ